MDEDEDESFEFNNSPDDINRLSFFPIDPNKNPDLDFFIPQEDFIKPIHKTFAHKNPKKSQSRYFYQDQENFSDDDTTSDFRNGQSLIPLAPVFSQKQNHFAVNRNPQISANAHERIKTLKSVENIPEEYRNIFSKYPYFNDVQSAVFDKVVHTSCNMVISAPTSSGKTVVLELAIVRLLTTLNYNRFNRQRFKIIYMAPIKALCTEKFNEWQEKFEKLHNLKCIQVTGDSDETAEFCSQIHSANIICTTPEKWDYMTRKWIKDASFMSTIKLVLIDEIHVLGESDRGATIEAVISRMKTFILKDSGDFTDSSRTPDGLRFLAISATIPNIEDVASWLGSGCRTPAIVYKLNETYRPVKVNNIVQGVYCSPDQNDFMFENSLSYKLSDIIDRHSNRKPTLIFCSTRKSTTTSSGLLAQNKKYFLDRNHESLVFAAAAKLRDPKLKDLVTRNGIGYHHAGMDSSDRSLIENLFLNAKLLVLFCTSTLAVGVNLPAHLVIIKGTKMYQQQQYVDYSTTQILQMIGRAGRPQFDKTATSIILTKEQDKIKYASLLEGTQLIESQLHLGLIEHLNSEICLGTITNLQTAISWLKSTFLFVRVQKNPEYYGFSPELKYRVANKQVNDNPSLIDEYLAELLVKSLTDLNEVTLVNDSDFRNPYAKIRPTINGQLMMRYYIRFETMKLIILKLDPQFVKQRSDGSDAVTLQDLLMIISQSKELEDVQLRQNERSVLNALNNDGKIPKSKAGLEALDLRRDKQVIRFIMPGKVKSRDMKINVLLQAELGCVPIGDGNNSLRQDNYRIFKVGIFEFISKNIVYKNYRNYINSLMLVKCLGSNLWHNSVHIFKQISNIGEVISNHLVRANITTIDSLLETSAPRIEAIINKNPPFGTRLLESVRSLPKFSIKFNLIDSHKPEDCLVEIHCFINNFDIVWKASKTKPPAFFPDCYFVLGDANNNLLDSTRLNMNKWSENEGEWRTQIRLNRKENADYIHASVIAKNFVGLDVHESFTPFKPQQSIPLAYEGNQFVAEDDEEDEDALLYAACVRHEATADDYNNEDEYEDEYITDTISGPMSPKIKKNVIFEMPTQSFNKPSSRRFNFNISSQKSEDRQTTIDSFFPAKKVQCKNPLAKQTGYNNSSDSKSVSSVSSSSSITSVSSLFSKEKTEGRSQFSGGGMKNKNEEDLLVWNQPAKKLKSSIIIEPIKPSLKMFEYRKGKFQKYESTVNSLFEDDEAENKENSPVDQEIEKCLEKSVPSEFFAKNEHEVGVADRRHNSNQLKQKNFLKNLFQNI